ncbi:HJR/Mrr/RecB family endonuclease [Paenibacillus endophyticus]|uniref:HJR/Mrr/RecB family endonuclease n=1 Tax=Paenibacillus endophyticus TaxID=1294268 RepID=A0A7W5GDB5_9BACL|nr:restriction endonuclease [Paenibacillus endophyticus]MBB3156249.1 HJR/Mrr/RecB family endonuclease [Paenibacillus endophyticus]
MLGAGWGAYSYTSSIIAAGIAAGAILAVYTFIISSINHKQTEPLKRAGIAEVDKMEGRQFEKYLGHLFISHGYKVEVKQAAGDFGADLILLIQIQVNLMPFNDSYCHEQHFRLQR